MAYHYFLNLGTNIGQRKLNLSRAVRAIESRFGYFEMSKMVESRPWGFVSDNVFCNVAVMVISDREPLDVLAELQQIEKEMSPAPHRHADGSYADRLIDIDIVAVDELQIDTPQLQVPHRHLAARRFFLEPMTELAPMWRHPASGLTCAEMLAQLPEPKDDENNEQSNH